MDKQKRKLELSKFLSEAGLSSVQFSGLIEEMAFLEENDNVNNGLCDGF